MPIKSKLLKLRRLLYTLTPLKPIQYWGFFYYRLLRKVVPFGLPRRKASNYSQLELKFERYMNNPWQGGYKFNFLNTEAEISSKNWSADDQSLLWQYNLYYFDFLYPKNKNNFSKAQANLVTEWWSIHKLQQGITWEPYPTSLRAVNLCKWGWEHNKGFSLIDQNTWIDILDRHYQEIKRKIEYHIQANHLFANFKALWFLHAALPEYRKKNSKWLCRKIQIELSKQFDKDGGHFELSPMYHRIMLWDLFDMFFLGRFLEKITPEEKTIVQKIETLLPPALCWAYALSHPDKEVAFFNDSCMKVGPSLKDISSYANKLNINIQKINNGFYSGYAVAKLKNILLLCDTAEIGPNLQPGHAHADSLSFELSIKNQRIIVNTGISEYNNSHERLMQRSTASHNTVCLDGKNSSDIWSSFRVGKRARIIDRSFEQSEKYIVITASHNGYKPITHYRKWILSPESLRIIDRLNTQKQKVSYFYFHPKIKIKKINNNKIIIFWENNKAIIEIKSEVDLIEIKKSKWHPEFGKTQYNKCLAISFNSELCEIEIVWKTK